MSSVSSGSSPQLKFEVIVGILQCATPSPGADYPGASGTYMLRVECSFKPPSETMDLIKVVYLFLFDKHILDSMHKKYEACTLNHNSQSASFASGNCFSGIVDYIEYVFRKSKLLYQSQGSDHLSDCTYDKIGSIPMFSQQFS